MRADPNGGYVRIRDIARVELGSQDYTVNAYLNKAVATAIVIYQRPGSNALTTAAAVSTGTTHTVTVWGLQTGGTATMRATGEMTVSYFPFGSTGGNAP